MRPSGRSQAKGLSRTQLLVLDILGQQASSVRPISRILEFALRESLRESNRHTVWNDDAFKVSREADALANTQDLDACRQTTLPYGNSVRTLQVDMVAFDSADESIRAYEIKRGNGQFDAGKIRSIMRDLKCIQVLLKSYGELATFKPASAESKFIFYYGVRLLLHRPAGRLGCGRSHRRAGLCAIMPTSPKATDAPGVRLRQCLVPSDSRWPISSACRVG
jgi:hypothetical protein